MLYWTNEWRTVLLAKVVDKCVFVCSTAINRVMSEDFVRKGLFRFYSKKSYNLATKELEALL